MGIRDSRRGRRWRALENRVAGALEERAPPPGPSAATRADEDLATRSTLLPVDTLGRFMRVQDVAVSVGVSRAMVYRLMHEPHDPFPAPIKIGSASIWVEREVAAWKARRVESQRL